MDDEDSYEDMLLRIYQIMDSNENIIVNRTIKIRLPRSGIIGSRKKRTVWVNFIDVIKPLNRNELHIIEFIKAEFGTKITKDNYDRLIINGVFNNGSLENVLRKYIHNYVKCTSCCTLHTILERDSITKLTFMNCKYCGSTRNVEPIVKGFNALKE